MLFLDILTEFSLMEIDQVLIVSPHCDDAIFSMGGTICELSRRSFPIDIVTCFNISNYMVNGHTQDTSTITKIRQREDSMVSLILQRLNMHYFELEDAPLRRDRTYANLYNCRFFSNEVDLINRISGMILPFLNRRTLLFGPLGIGNHIDHILCRVALERGNFNKNMLLYYEDQPYQAKMRQCVTPFIIERESLVCINLDQKSEIMKAYQSQLTKEDLVAVLAHARTISPNKGPCERFWRK